MSRCTYVRCETPPTTTIQPPYGKRWLGCDEHAPAMSAALGGTSSPINGTVAKSGKSWDDREGPTWIDSL